MNQILPSTALFMLLLTAFVAYLPTKVYSQLPFVPSSPESIDNNTSSTTTASNNQSSITSTSSQQQTPLTYTDPEGRFSIDYPSNSIAKPINDPKTNILVEFPLRTGTSSTDGLLSISMENATKYLDTKTLQVKTHSLRDYVNDEINKINSPSYKRFGIGPFKYVRDNPTTVAGNPAWTVSYTHDPFLYYTTTYMIKDNKLYTFDYESGQLKVPETLPMAQKMINSFRLLASATKPIISRSAEIPKLNGNHWGIENATADFRNGANYNPYNSCNFKRDGPEFCDAYIHAYDITWNMLKDKARNEQLKQLYRNDKDIQEMIK